MQSETDANVPVHELVARAVQQAYDAWAAEHPSLASVIDRIELTQQTVESLRNSQAYREAVDAFHAASGGLDLLEQLIDLAKPLIVGLLAG